MMTVDSPLSINIYRLTYNHSLMTSWSTLFTYYLLEWFLFLINVLIYSGISQLDFSGPNDNEDTGIVDNAETIYQMKIQCAADCVRAYVHNQQTNDPCQKIDIVKLFRSYRISDDQPEPDNNWIELYFIYFITTFFSRLNVNVYWINRQILFYINRQHLLMQIQFQSTATYATPAANFIPFCAGRPRSQANRTHVPYKLVVVCQIYVINICGAHVQSCRERWQTHQVRCHIQQNQCVRTPVRSTESPE